MKRCGNKWEIYNRLKNPAFRISFTVNLRYEIRQDQPDSLFRIFSKKNLE